MNDKNKKAFDEWLSEAGNHYADALAYEFEKHLCFVSWQAACEYKDKDILEYKEASRSEADEVNRLQAENKKLREALEAIAKDYDRPSDMMKKAREALKEVEE